MGFSVTEQNLASGPKSIDGPPEDCSAPNAVLVHASICTEFLDLVRERIAVTPVGDYSNRNCRVGPVSVASDLPRIQKFLVDHRQQYHRPDGSGRFFVRCIKASLCRSKT